MKTSRNYKIAILEVISIISLATVVFAETELVKDRSSNVIAGKPAAESILAFGIAQNEVDVKNGLLLYEAAVAAKYGIDVPDLPALNTSSFGCSDPADPRWKCVVVNVNNASSGGYIYLSNSTGTNWPVNHYFWLDTQTVRNSCGYGGTNYQPYQAGYDKELAYQISIVDRGIELYGISYTDTASRDNLVKVRDYLKYYQYKYADFTSGALNRKGNGAILTRTGGVVTLYNYRKNVLDGGYAVDLKSGKVYTVDKSGTKVEIVKDKIARRILGAVKDSIKEMARKELDNDKRISGAMLARQIKELRKTR